MVSSLVLLSALIAMLSSILSSLKERQREMAILRAVGAEARHIFGSCVVKHCY
ncbi:MAG: FtsX-like permease family protein [Deinococcales bacterium]